MESNAINTKTLSTIIDDAKRLELAVWDSGGELTEEIESLLAINAQDLSQKVDNYAMLLQRIEIAEDYYKKCADRYRDAASKMGKIHSKLSENVHHAMDVLKVKSLSGELNSFSIRLNPPSVVIDDETKIDRNYFKEVITYSIEKKRLKDDLKMGLQVSGAHMEQRSSLKIGVTKLSLGEAVK